MLEEKEFMKAVMDLAEVAGVDLLPEKRPLVEEEAKKLWQRIKGELDTIRGCQAVCYSLNHIIGGGECDGCPINDDELERIGRIADMKEQGEVTERSYLVEIQKMASQLPKFDDGRINYTDAKLRMAVHVIIQHKNELLILKRSDKVGVYQGKWNLVAGYLDDPQKKLITHAMTEIAEEIGDVGEILYGYEQPHTYTDPELGITFLIFTIRVVLTKKPEITLNEEHTECRWIKREELKDFDLVPSINAEGAPIL